MMRFLANENFPYDAVMALRGTGYDVAWVLTDNPGISDKDVLQRANIEGRILLTFDKDFGELAFREGLSSECGIILFRIPKSSSAEIARIVVSVLSSRSDWTGHFSVIETNRIRMRVIPPIRTH